MAKITQAVLLEAATEVLKEFSMSTTTTPVSSPIGDVSPGRRETDKEIKETPLEKEEGFHKSGFGLSSNDFNNALKSLVKTELQKMLQNKEKKSEKK